MANGMNKEVLKALRGHENRAKILEILSEPTDPRESLDWKNGYFVDCPHSMDSQDPAEGQSTVHRLLHWRGGFDPEAFRDRDAGAKKKRALHGLDFMEKPHRNGRYEKRLPKNRQKVLAAYLAQHKEEWGK